MASALGATAGVPPVGGGTLNDARATYEAARDGLLPPCALPAQGGTHGDARGGHNLGANGGGGVERSCEANARRRSVRLASRSLAARTDRVMGRSIDRRHGGDERPLGAPTQQQLDTRERELADMRVLDALGNGCWRRCRSTRRRTTDSRARRRGTSATVSGEAKTVFDAMEAAKTEAEAQKASVARG